jgi:conjugative relaxase-like TrwC/TraI family protein
MLPLMRHLIGMLTAKAQYNLDNAEKYFKEHLAVGDHHAKGDYYSEGRQVIGQWFGAGAEKLKLRGDVGLDDFTKLCRNLNPKTNALLTQRMRKNRRVFYDFTLSPPKSVSIVALAGGDGRIERAHERATMTALAELEKFAAARVRKNRASTFRNTGNMAAAVFKHDTSRALDPHLHCHCVVFNATFDASEGKWKALETCVMLQAAKYVENVYYHELARELKRLGYGIQNNSRGDFEIDGVSKELVDRFSKRHNEIDKKTRELLEHEPDKRGQNVKEIRERIAHNERARKIKDIGRKRLAELWDKQITNEETAALAALKHSRAVAPVKGVAVVKSVAWAEQHLFDRRSVVNEFELWRYALEHGRGENFSVKNLQSLTARKPYVRNDEQRGKITTRATLEREQRLIAAAQDGCGQFTPFNGKHQIKNASLDDEQRDAAKQILASQDFVTLFRGGAGTGKSFTLKEVRDGLLAAGRAVHVIAPQRQQVIDLEKDLGARGATVSEFLARAEMEHGAAVVVDEAGQIGAKQMLQLFELVQVHNGRLILSGDTRQHGAVEASDALRVIEKFAGLEAIELKNIWRQNPELAKTKAEHKAIKQYKLAVVMARDGLLAASFDTLNKSGAITQCGLYEQQKFLTDKYLELMAAGHSTVVVSQTWSELHKVNEQIRSALQSRGLIGQSDLTVKALVKRDLTDAQKCDERYYNRESVLLFNRGLAGIKQGALGQVLFVGEQELFVTASGKVRSISFDDLESVSVCEPKSMTLASGDRLQLKANAKTAGGRQLANGELVTVKRVENNGEIELEDGRILPMNYRQFVRGYAITSYAAQGKNADHVIFSDSAIRAATNQNQWYVTISRGRKGVHIFTTDKQQLRENIASLGNRQLAIELAGRSNRQKQTASQRLRMQA